jgi:ABC-2 type transport system permease protein
LNRDNGKLSYELTQRFQGSSYFSNIKYLKNVDQIKKAIDMQEAIVVLHIDDLFSRNLLEGKTGEVQLILDGRRSNSAQIVQGYALKIIQQYNEEIARKEKLPVSSTILIPRNWFNPNLIYTWFNIPGLVAILTMTTALLVTSLSIARERELGTFDQLLVSPLRPIDILIGKTIPGIIIGIIEGCGILLAGVFVFQIPFTGSILLLFLSMLIFVSSIVGIGLFLSSLCKTQQQALLAVFVFISVSVILSGFATPIDNMPIWLQKVTIANPLRFFIVITRGLFLKAMPCKLVLLNLIPIFIVAVINLFVANWFLKRRSE